MDATAIARYRAAERLAWRSLGVEPKERWVGIPPKGIRVRVLEIGEGRPAWFVHGLPTAGSIWAPLVALMRGNRCLVLDRPGCGLSDRPEGVSTARSLVDVQTAALDALAIERVDVVGNSFGGACALWLAQARPDRVDRIVLEGVPTVWGIKPTWGNRLLAAGPVGMLVARRRWSRRDIGSAFRQIGHGRLLDSGHFEGPLAALALSIYNDTDTLRNETALLQSSLGWRGFRRSGLFDPAALSRIGRPTLWLWGTEDPYATVDRGRKWASSMPQATFETCEGEGHLPWLDDPERHARRIERFLADRPVERASEEPTAEATGTVAADHVTAAGVR